MKCSEAEELMMKYMDNELSESDAKRLNSHILECVECKESFFIYGSLISDLKILSDYEAPLGFEAEVLAKISTISIDNNGRCTIKSRVNGVIWGTFSVLFGTGTMLVMYREPIMKSLLGNPYIGDTVSKLIPISMNITEQGNIIKNTADTFIGVISSTLANSIGIILAILTLICATQFIMIRNKKRTK